MAFGRDDAWDSSSEVYAPDEVEAVLKSLGVSPVEETEQVFLSFCPFHGNTRDPAFATNKTTGFSICFNPACAIGSEFRLTLELMVMKLKGLNKLQAKRFILSSTTKLGLSFEEKFDILEAREEEELRLFPASAIDKMHNRLLDTQFAYEYLEGRGFDRQTIEYFKVGFTPASTAPIYKPDMVVVPAYDDKARPVGLVGRSVVGKDFKNFGPNQNGTGFKKSKIIWNLQNAKKHDTIILTEATFDSMSVHQAGYPNVGALLGGTLSKTQKMLLGKYFKHVIIMTDNEVGDNVVYHKHCMHCMRQGSNMCLGHKPGRDLGMKIASELPHLRVSWAVFNNREIYPRNVKDANGMTGDEIRQCLHNIVSHFDYLEWIA